MAPLVPGLYDQPITEALRELLDRLPDSLRSEEMTIEGADAPWALARLLHDRLLHAFRSMPTPEDGSQLDGQLALANRVVDLLVEHAGRSGAKPSDRLSPPGRRLLSVVAASSGDLGKATPPERPQIPLTTSDLLVNSHHDLSLGPEVRRELASTDRADLLCSFLKWSGFRLMENALRELLRRRPGGLRVITTAYMGATERRALDELARMGAQVRVSYDVGRTRLHAKAWLFHRESGFSTGCVGSSNLSAAAMLDGLEWNVRLSQTDNAPILAKFAATFEQYWADPEFQPYDPERDAAQFDAAVRRQVEDRSRLLLAIQVEPKRHQIAILESLAAERERGHRRNLVVAATGTGKTIVAALDYKRLRGELGGRAKLLFVAHRNEILEQSRMTFRVVLHDPVFGEKLAAGEEPLNGDHVFASVQSLHEDRLRSLPPDAYDIVIVDEFHHAAAPTYETLLQHLKPKILLGLTATPERTDGKSILGWFDGRVAAELRLWQALEQGLLSPFQYFGISDGTDLRNVDWSPAGYDRSELSNVYTAADGWVKLVLSAVERKVANISRMRALGFCVDVAHAEFMARHFSRAGIESVAVTERTKAADRAAALARLGRGELRVVFSVDLFNEGVDVPDVDTVLFLRPTESATVFLQQLGRGLRRADGKECLTVLDFIGNAHRRFRFDRRFQGILGGTRKQIEREVESGFPTLPSGCSIQLDREAQETVLTNIREALGLGSRRLREDLSGIGRDVDLATFLEASGAELEDVYARAGRSWTRLRREANLVTPAEGPGESQLENALARMLHVDDPYRLEGYGRLLSASAPPRPNASDALQRMLFADLGFVRASLEILGAAWDTVWRNPAIRSELLELLALLEDRRRQRTFSLYGDLAGVPLQVHARYALDEVMAAFDERDSKGRVKRLREGVFYAKESKADLLFVTLEKSESDYSPTTLYNDYPISPSVFHWESQSGTSSDSPTGKRYRSGGQVLLFVRQKIKDPRGLTMPYLFLGPVEYVRHSGDRPMQIHWRLKRDMPATYFQETKLAEG